MSTDSDLQKQVDALPWFHSIDFGNGIVSRGVKSLEHLQAVADIYFRESVEGLSVLEVACWDGYMSFEAHKRGAARVLATDHFVWTEASWGRREAFDLAREHVAPEVEVMDIDVHDITPATVGTFDVVLFLGVFYHLRHPFLALEQMAAVTKQRLIVSSHIAALDVDRPAMIFYPGKELANDATNWWGANPACIEAMLHVVGFPTVSYMPHPYDPKNAGIFHACR